MIDPKTGHVVYAREATPLAGVVQELLEALRAYVEQDDCIADPTPHANNALHDDECNWCRAQTAIAKAEDRT